MTQNDNKAYPTKIDNLLNEYAIKTFKLAPASARIDGHDVQVENPDFIGDLSPEGIEKESQLNQEYLLKVKQSEPESQNDKISKSHFIDSVSLEQQFIEIGKPLKHVNNISSPIQNIAMMFDLAPRKTIDDIKHIINSLNDVPRALNGYKQTLKLGVDRQIVNSSRQAKNGMEYAEKYASDQSSLNNILEYTKGIEGVSDELKNALSDALSNAKNAYADLSDFLKKEYLPHTKDIDGVGEKEYELAARKEVGYKIDLKETYEWGVSEVERIVSEQAKIARKHGVNSTGDLRASLQGIRIFDADSKYKVYGIDNLQKWMQKTADESIQFLIKNDYFDIPSPMDELDCQISNSNEGMIYYTPASDDFSRKGTMWWGVPSDVNEFSTWREKTTVYHEGCPGHHLQTARQIYNKDKLNLYRRALSWIPGHGEGWALYAEQLMDEFGFLSDDADKYGQLFGERMRAARIVIDMGLHLGFDIPKSWQYLYGSGKWTWDSACKFFADSVDMQESFRTFEMNRYLGWPGQAISYKVGMRKWLQIRKIALDSGLTLKQFHAKALDQGCISLDILQSIFVNEK